MASKPFKIQPHSGVDKSFEITGPEDFCMAVDYDDVNHRAVDKMAKRVVRILNENFLDEKPQEIAGGRIRQIDEL